MDWKYKHFHQERTFAAESDAVLDAVRSFVSGSLGWKVSESANGLTTEGNSFYHAAIADFRLVPAGNETKVVVDLRVERAGGAGFMLADVGGYYNIQIRKWLDGVQTNLHQELTQPAQPSLVPPPPARSKTGARIFHGCMALIFIVLGLWLLVTAISAIVGEITGTLYLWGRGGTLVVHGWAARMLATGILLVTAWILWKVRHTQRARS